DRQPVERTRVQLIDVPAGNTRFVRLTIGSAVTGAPAAPTAAPTEPKDQWVISRRPAHPALVSEQDFVAVQAINAAPRPDTDETPRRPVPPCPPGSYEAPGAPATLLTLGLPPARRYRCRHGHTSTRRSDPDRPKNIYIREDAVIAFAAVHLGVPFDNPEQIAE